MSIWIKGEKEKDKNADIIGSKYAITYYNDTTIATWAITSSPAPNWHFAEVFPEGATPCMGVSRASDGIWNAHFFRAEVKLWYKFLHFRWKD